METNLRNVFLPILGAIILSFIAIELGSEIYIMKYVAFGLIGLWLIFKTYNWLIIKSNDNAFWYNLVNNVDKRDVELFMKHQLDSFSPSINKYDNIVRRALLKMEKLGEKAYKCKEHTILIQAGDYVVEFYVGRTGRRTMQDDRYIEIRSIQKSDDSYFTTIRSDLPGLTLDEKYFIHSVMNGYQPKLPNRIS